MRVGQITNEEARAINNQMPGNQVWRVGENLQLALENRTPRQQQYIRYVDGNVASSGDGRSWEGAFKTISELITEMNLSTNDGMGVLGLVAPGDYIEVAASVPTLSSDDNEIRAIGTPEDTLWYGSGTSGTKSASTDHLLHITGSNNIVTGLSVFTYKNDKASIYIDDASSGGNSNIIRGVYFSPQTQDGVKYCVQFNGGAKNIIIGNQFFGALTSGIQMAAGSLHVDNNLIIDNHFVGTGIGINIAGINDNTVIKNNLFSIGAGTNENMTNAIVITSAMTAGSVTLVSNFFEQSLANSVSDSKVGGSLYNMNSSYGS